MIQFISLTIRKLSVAYSIMFLLHLNAWHDNDIHNKVNILKEVDAKPHFYKLLIVGQICNSFEKNRALYDKSMKLGT